MALLLHGCAGDPPVFLQVIFPGQAYFEEREVQVAARLWDDRGVAGVQAVVLDATACDVPALVDGTIAEAEAYRLRINLKYIRNDVWQARLPLSAGSDLSFYLEAWDEEELRSEAPGEASSEQLQLMAAPGARRRLFRVQALLGGGPACGPWLPPCPPGEECRGGLCLPGPLCAGTPCPAGQRCHEESGSCLPPEHCLWPENSCDALSECDSKTGLCRLLGPCSGVFCPPGQQCHPQRGVCVAKDHCGLEPASCPPRTVCDDATGRCRDEGLCSGVSCPAGQLCDVASGVCRFLPGTLCGECTAHRDCPDPDDYCLLYGDHRACGQDCRSRACPGGFVCRSFGNDRRQCVHASGSCHPEYW